MKRRARTEILIKGSRETAKALCNEIENKYKISVVDEPNNGLVMIKMREDAKKSLFYLGEVLVTEAKVQINNKLGLGIVRGTDSELAYWLAVIDAACNAGLKETEKWDIVLENEQKKIIKEIQRQQSKILKTKVSFDTMSE